MKASKIFCMAVLAGVIVMPSQVHAVPPRLITHIKGDLQSSFTQLPILILAGGVLATVALYPVDDQTDQFFVDHHFSNRFDGFAQWGGQPLILNGAAAAAYGVSLFTNNEKFQRTTETMVEALIFNDVMTSGLKYGFSRQRPNGGSLSFPSGHASTVFTIASVLHNMHGWRAGVPAYTVATLVAYGRLDGGYHHLTDVVFGAALGSFIGYGTSLFHKEDSKLLFSPILDQTRGIMISYKF